MKLIGSTTSPYVRKVRLLLLNEEYEFETLKALTKEGSDKLATYGPIKRIPILISNNQTIFDSSIICEYLLEQQGIKLSINEKLNLRLIDELCDSGIILFQQKIWDIDIEWKNEFSRRMLERVVGTLGLLNDMIKKNNLGIIERDWLYCVLDWFNFRSIYNFNVHYEELNNFYNSSFELEKYKSTSLN
jgi:glutathione S-transferase